MRSVAQKMGVREGTRAFVLNAPTSALRAIELPHLEISKTLTGKFDYIHLFCATQIEMDEAFPKLKCHLKQQGKLWVSWPKEKKLGTNLGMRKVIEIGYNHGLVESTCLRIDDVWAGLKVTHPKVGKTYNNSYGTLPDEERSCISDASSGT